MTDMFGISRGPDTRPPEVKAAADKIVIGWCSFFCTECKQSGPIEPKHMEDCYVGKILAAWMARPRDKRFVIPLCGPYMDVPREVPDVGTIENLKRK